MPDKDLIARRVAQELHDGDVVNLGIGLPTLVASYVPDGVRIVLQSENGMLGMGPFPDGGRVDRNITNAGGKPVTALCGASFFDSAMSFSILRGGHVNLAVLGALQVDETGSLASHMIPGKLVPGMGGAMDLAAGAKRLIVAMTHTAKDGAPKLVRRLTLPVTAVGRVSMIVTELGVIRVTPDGLLLTEIMEGVTVEQVREATQATLYVAETVRIISSACRQRGLCLQNDDK